MTTKPLIDGYEVRVRGHDRAKGAFTRYLWFPHARSRAHAVRLAVDSGVAKRDVFDAAPIYKKQALAQKGA